MNENPRVLGNRYELGALLGRGGMAEVHLGHDTRLGRTVAVKLLRTDLARDPTFQARFRREAQSAAALNHPAIVAVYDTSEELVRDATGGTTMLPYIVMEHVQGHTLREMIEESKARITAAMPPGSEPPPGSGALDTGFALEATSGVLSALEYSHRSGIVHRDIKPANVMVTPSGAVKVMDFGIARALTDSSATMTQTHAVIGTAQYLSPEQARGEQVDARSDLYSTGCLLFELLTGRPPFIGDSPVSVAYQHVREEPPLPSSINPAVPESVDRIVMHALAKERTQRYQNATEFRQDVDAALAGRRVAAPALTAATQLVGGETATQYLPGTGAGTRTMAASGAMLPGAPAGLGEEYGADPYGNGYPSRRSLADERQQQRNRGPAYVLLVLAVLAAFVLGAWWLSGMLGGDDEKVPEKIEMVSVVGQPVAEATKALEDKGFVVSTTTEQSTPDKKGLVIEQDPLQGSFDRGSRVYLTVGSGPDSIEVPDVEGLSVEEATAKLVEAGLTVATTHEDQDLTEQIVEKSKKLYDKNTVIQTEPGAGEDAVPETSVRLVVSTGFVIVPEVTDNELGKAKARLEALGFKIRVREQEDGTVEPGKVLEQSTANGQRVAIGSSITLLVSKQPTVITTVEPTTTTTTPSPTTTTTTMEEGMPGNRN
ncbi:MAG: Stk1 family PASTA domain-containing Ser/Thr kinase [Actinomycetales bacterium]|nr:Stk1 family PASTA domain-containing Ser/Thr kinase [Actinomycetales bacterium]